MPQSGNREIQSQVLRPPPKRQLTLHFDAEVANALEAEGKRRGLTLARTANDIVRKSLIDEATEKLADTVKARLDRLDRRVQARARELTFIKEMILLQIRTWFEYVGPFPDDDPDAGADAEARFAAFLEILSEQLS